MSNFVDKYCEFPVALRRPMWRIWHNLLIRFDKESRVNFMNYGYESLNGDPVLNLQKKDEINRYCIQLYNHVATGSSLKGKKVTEIGSGRGGGADFISRYHKPKSYTGVDISSGVISFCNRFYNTPGLNFKEGKAEKIPMPTGSTDVVLNVESARCYSNIETFFKEVHRILTPKGEFLFADMIETDDVNSIRNKLQKNGFIIVSEKNITRNVAKGLELDTGRREQLINNNIPGSLRKSFSAFAGTKGTKRYNSFNNGKFEYWSFVLNKVA